MRGPRECLLDPGVDCVVAIGRAIRCTAISGIAAAAAETLARLNPEMTFVFVSGVGLHSMKKGRILWARVRARPRVPSSGCRSKALTGGIQPLHGIRSRTALYNVGYVLFAPLMPVLRWAVTGAGSLLRKRRAVL
jgi:hypothetical protein